MRSNLILLRREKKLTQAKVAENLGISRAHYAKIETGDRNPSFALSQRIKKYFAYNNDDIFEVEHNSEGCKKHMAC